MYEDQVVSDGSISWKVKNISPASLNNENWTQLSDFALVNHNHDDRYSQLNHNHDTSYSAINHNHDTVYAAASHGNHVPITETANNAKFLRNDNTWQTVTPANIGAATSNHTHSNASSSSSGFMSSSDKSDFNLINDNLLVTSRILLQNCLTDDLTTKFQDGGSYSMPQKFRGFLRYLMTNYSTKIYKVARINVLSCTDFFTGYTLTGFVSGSHGVYSENGLPNYCSFLTHPFWSNNIYNFGTSAGTFWCYKISATKVE